MDRWKTIAMMSLGFTCGVVWTAACGGADSAKADDSGYEDDGAGGGSAGAGGGSAGSGGGTPPPSSHGGARTVLELEYNTDGRACYEGESANSYEVDCCPSGFTWVGSASRGAGEGHQVCLENAS
jgi:hypothetical protein